MKKYIFILITLTLPTTSQTTNKKINILSFMMYIYKIIDSGYEEKKDSYTIMSLSLQEDEINKLTEKDIIEKIISAKKTTEKSLLNSLEHTENKIGEHEKIRNQLKELPTGLPIEEIKKLLTENFEEYEYKQTYSHRTELLLIRFFGVCELHKKVDDAFKNNKGIKEIVAELYRKNKELNASFTTDIAKIDDSGTADVKEENETPDNKKVDIERNHNTSDDHFSVHASDNDFSIYTIDNNTFEKLNEIYGTKLTNVATIKEEYNELKKILATSQGATEKATALHKNIKTLQALYAAAKNQKERDRSQTETNYVYQNILIEIDKNFPLHTE